MIHHVHWGLLLFTTVFYLEHDAVEDVMLSEVSAQDVKNVISLAGDQHLTEQVQQMLGWEMLYDTLKVTCLTFLGKTGPFTRFCSY